MNGVCWEVKVACADASPFPWQVAPRAAVAITFSPFPLWLLSALFNFAGCRVVSAVRARDFRGANQSAHARERGADVYRTRADNVAERSLDVCAQYCDAAV